MNTMPAPVPSSLAVRARFQRQARRDTGPELAVRRAVHAVGLRYRVDHRPLPSFRRSADLVFPGERVAVFVDGCFWHACPYHRSAPKANADWWQAKLDRTVARDRDSDRHLASEGWVVVRVWEHEHPGKAALRIAQAVRRRRSHRS
nr:very short patch repair endonuclease [Acidimicrobiales bacterium]